MNEESLDSRLRNLLTKQLNTKKIFNAVLAIQSGDKTIDWVGAVGSYYSGRLAEAGHDVRFSMRCNYRAVRESSLKFTSPNGDFILTGPRVELNSEEIGPVDWFML